MTPPMTPYSRGASFANLLFVDYAATGYSRCLAETDAAGADAAETDASCVWDDAAAVNSIADFLETSLNRN